MKTIKILIPIYNEEESLLFLRNRLTSIINKLQIIELKYCS